MLDATAGMYRFRIMPLDMRHHRFIAMIDVARNFRPNRHGQVWNFPDIEALIKKSAFERFGLVLDGIYWRVNPAVPASRAVASGDETIVPSNPFQLVSDEERDALMDAICKGTERPVLRAGEREYQSEMAPLDEHGNMRGHAPRRLKAAGRRIAPFIPICVHLTRTVRAELVEAPTALRQACPELSRRAQGKRLISLNAK